MKGYSFLVIAVSLALLAAGPAFADDKAFSASMEKYLSNDANVEKVGNALERYFMKKRENKQKAAAKAEGQKLEEQFKNPIQVPIGKSPVKGPADAKVTIIEFSDFQCPFCGRGMKTMDDVMKEYPKDVKLVFKHLPLPFHPEAKPAAVASLAAGEQGKFWEMHDALFQNVDRLGKDLYIELAGKLELDIDKFKADLKNPALAKLVEEDLALAAKLGVRGTPGFFVNGVQVRGARPLPYFKTIIDRWLKEAK